MNAFAIIRHKKIKAGRHLVATGLHNARQIATPNADKTALPVHILVGSRKPWKDVSGMLNRLEIGKVRSNGNVAIEIFLGASPEWWAAKGWKPGMIPTGETLDLIEQWKAEQLAYLEDRFGKHLLASVVFHADEASPHMHALVIPAQFRKDGRERGERAGTYAWRLSTEKVLPGPKAMKSIVTDYAHRMRGFGLVRGEDRPHGTIKHRPLKEWQEDQAEMSDRLRKEIMKQISVTDDAEKEAERIRQEAIRYAENVKAMADKRAKEARDLLEVRAEMLRRKEDGTNAARLQVQAEHKRAIEIAQANEMARGALETLRAELEGMISKAEMMLEPIRALASKWLQSSPMIRQAIGSKGPEAVKLASSEQVRELEAMRNYMTGRGMGR